MPAGNTNAMIEVIERLFAEEDPTAALAYLDFPDNGLSPEDSDRLDKMFRQHPEMTKEERVEAIRKANKGADQILKAGKAYVEAETEEQRELKFGTLAFKISQQAKANVFRK